MSRYRKPGTRITSGWYDPLKISVDDYMEYDDNWCSYLETFELSCRTWAPGNMQTADYHLRQYLMWMYGRSIHQWAQENGLGNRYNFEFEIWNEFPFKKRVKCGVIQGVAIGKTYGGSKSRKNMKRRRMQTRRH